METLNLTTFRLKIRNLKSGDLNDFHVYRSNPEVTKYQGFDVMTLEQARAFIKEQTDKQFGKAGEWVQYAIENKETGKLIGDCAIKLDQYDTRIAEVGITISHLHQKKGFAKEVLRGILTFLFDTKQIHRVVEIVDAENAASIALLKSFTDQKVFFHFIFYINPTLV